MTPSTRHRLIRAVLLGAAVGAGLMALANALGANPHALPLAACHVPNARWSALTTHQQEHYVRCNLRHAHGAIDYVKHHPELYDTRSLAAVARVVLHDHRALVRKARRNLRAIELRLHPPHVLPGWFIALCECETQTPVLWTYDDGLYHGGPNFLLSTWDTYGGQRYAPTPEQATPWEQYQVTLAMHADVPWSQSNPACSARVGLR